MLGDSIYKSKALATLSPWIFAAVCYFRSTPAFAAESSPEDQDAATVIAAVQGAVTSVADVVASYQVYCKTTGDNFGKTGTILGEDGQGLFCDFEWGWERSSSREFLYGRHAFVLKDHTHYQRVHFAFDGQKLLGCTPEGFIGKIGSEVEETFVGRWRGPLQLFGQRIAFSPTRDLHELLNGATLIRIADSPANILTLRTTFDEGEPPGLNYTLIVSVDSKQGFIPVRIAIERTLMRTLSRLYETVEAVEVAPHIWFPIRGYVTWYYVDNQFDLPDGVKESDVEAMSEDAKRDVMARTTFHAVELGMGRDTFVVNRNTLRVNQGIPPQRFTFDFPPGTNVWDDFAQKSFKVPGGPLNTVNTVNKAPMQSLTSWWLVFVNGIVVMGLIVVGILRRRLKKST